MSTFSRFAALAAVVSLAATGCTSIVGDISFDRPEGTGGSTTSSSAGTGGSTSSSASSTGGATSSSSGTGGGSTCADASCDALATCDDTSGHAVCTCPSGYHDVHGDGTTCTDWDECAGDNGGNKCSASMNCTNTPGGYTCACAAGKYEHPAGSGNCVVDPCQPSPCENGGTCANGTGLPVCTCPVGFIGATCDTCVLFVDGAAGGAATGASWGDAFTTVQPALDAASAQVAAGAPTCDVWVKAGTYYVYVNDKFNAIFPRTNVGLYGGFDGTETLRSQADPGAHATVLSGRKSASSGLSVLHVVRVSEVVGAVVDGFTIRDGNADGSGGATEDQDGGGVLVYAFGKPASVTLSRCEITANTANYGGGVGTISFSPQLNITITGSDLHDNVANASGGGMACSGTSCTITGTTFRGNTASTAGGLSAGTLLIASDDVFADNTASSDGGGARFQNLHAGTTLSNLTFSGNFAGGTGGGLRVDGAVSAAIFNGLFVGNTTSAGGAVYDNTPGGFSCVGCTITGNRGTSQGDGIRWENGAPTLTDTIVWGNPSHASAATGTDISPATWTSVVTSHADIHGFGGADATSFDADPLFVAMPAFFDRTTIAAAGSASVLVASGALYKVNDVLEIAGDGVGRTVTQIAANTVTFAPALGAPAPANAAIRDWGTTFAVLDAHLGAGSTCIDAADAATAPASDLAGKARVGAPDIGAYEH
jgi:hypothetical protein